MAIAPLTASEVIALLDLAPLPGEGGYFRRTVATRNPANHDAPLNSAILYLVTPNSWSALHRLQADELFHFYMGDPCRQVIATPGAPVEERILGHDLRDGQLVQSLVPAGAWQATRLARGGDVGYALIGTTMTPGFRRDVFTLAEPLHLDQFQPEAREILRSYLAPQSP